MLQHYPCEILAIVFSPAAGLELALQNTLCIAWGSLLHILTKIIILLRMTLSYEEDTLYPLLICVVYQEPDDFELMDCMIHWVVLVDNAKAPQSNSLISFQWLSPTGILVVISQYCATHWYCFLPSCMSASVLKYILGHPVPSPHFPL